MSSSESDGEANVPIFSRDRTTERLDAPKAALKTNPKAVLKKVTMGTAKEPKGPKGEILSFSDLGVVDWLVKNCSSFGIRKPTPVQSVCIPEILNGREVVARSQTGTGKTATFALPILQRLFVDPFGIFALILSPTRELALQISEQFSALGAPMNVRVSLVIGGMNSLDQSFELSSLPHVVIATPGRLLDHMRSSTPPNFKYLKYLVLDEVDRLLDPTLDLDSILAALPPSLTTLLFSATVTSDVNEFVLARQKFVFLLSRQAQKHLKDPFVYEGEKLVITAEGLTQNYVFVPEQVKMCYFLYLMLHYGPSAESVGSSPPVRNVIVFTSTVAICQNVHEVLHAMDMDSVVLHSALDQKRRLANLGKFRTSLSRILVCTDVASRGLDIPEVDLVINFDLPRNPKDYVHRVGRTARIGRQGRAISFVTQFDIKLLHQVEAFIGNQLSELEGLREAEVLKLMEKTGKAIQVAKMHMGESDFYEKLEAWKKRKTYTTRRPESEEEAQRKKKRKTE